MSGIIHMDTDQVRLAANSFVQDIDLIEQYLSTLLNGIKGIPWEGGAHDQFISDLSSLVQKTLAITEDGRGLGLRVQREVEQWLTVDAVGSQGMKSTTIITIGILGTELGMGAQDLWWSFQYSEYKNWWDALSLDQKKQYLMEQYRKITSQLGLSTMPIVFDDLPDDGGDTRGVNTGSQIMLDIDNLSTDPPWRLVETLAHETRHQFQNEMVADYQKTGKIPSGITEDQIKAWSNDQGENYISPEDDVEGYWTQPVETDARDFGGSYMQTVFENKDWGAGSIPEPVVDPIIYA